MYVLAGSCIRGTICKYENETLKRWLEMPLILIWGGLESSMWPHAPLGTIRTDDGIQYVAMVTKLLSSYCGVH